MSELAYPLKYRLRLAWAYLRGNRWKPQSLEDKQLVSKYARQLQRIDNHVAGSIQMFTVSGTQYVLATAICRIDSEITK